MRAKSKLTLALLAATALFTLNPGMATQFFRGEELRANEIALELQAADSSTSDLDALAPAEGDKDQALVPNANGVMSEPGMETSVDVVTAPGENPFLPVATTTSAVKIEPAVITTPVAVEKSVPANPFVDQAAIAKQAKEAVVPAKPKVDDTALRYYATSKDLKRLGAEMRRLKSLYPDWEPPKNLFTPVTDISEQPLWEIYKSGDYTKVRGQIALIQSTNPKWAPSDDMMAKLEIGETRALLNRAFAQGRWQQVIDTARAKPSIMVCEEMQVVWNVAEALARTRNYAQSFDLYKYVLDSCDAPDLRLATVQKASLLLPGKGTASLVAMGRTNADGTSEFENLGFDGLRRQIGNFIQNGNFDQTPGDDDLRRFVDFIQRTGSGQDAALIGWYFYAQEEWKTANSWFIAAAKYERSPKNVEGVILTLRNMEEADQALKIARRFAKASPEITDQYIEIVASVLTTEKSDIVFSEKEIVEFARAVIKRKSALGAQALGWKYLSEGEKTTAGEWFTQSVSWKATEGGVVGLAVMAARAKDYKALTSIKAEYGKEFAELSNFKVYKAKTYKRYKIAKTNRKTKLKVAAESKPKLRKVLFPRES